jgi:hypothetical protein
VLEFSDDNVIADVATGSELASQIMVVHLQDFQEMRKTQPRQQSITLCSRPVFTTATTNLEEQTMSNALGYAKLAPKTPVPSDIEVSQQIVKEVGLLPISELGKQYVCGWVGVLCVIVLQSGSVLMRLN